MNPCLESTYNFLSKIIKYLNTIHSKYAGFHKVIHMGGDEVPHRAYNGRE